MNVLVVAAARPNFMKVAPILAVMERRGLQATLVHTGQHYDANMSDAFFVDLSIRPPDVHLGCAGGSHALTTASVMVAFDDIVVQHEPDAVVVVGDVDSTLACALVAAKRNVPVAHVEAGLRSRDRTMPEEVNRVVVDALSDWLFTPSPDATENLVREGVDRRRIHWVGNVMADSLLATLANLDIDARLSGYSVDRGEFGLLTLHRPSNVDDVATLVRLVGAVSEVSEQVPILFPVHPRTSPQLLLPEVQRILQGARGIRLLPPIGYQDCVALQAGAAIVLTDSGGLQEETTILGVPCLTLRESTERPITVTQGTNTVVGTDSDAIATAARQALTMRDVPRTPPVGWDGHAAERIVTALLSVPAPLDTQRQQPVGRSVLHEEARLA